MKRLHVLSFGIVGLIVSAAVASQIPGLKNVMGEGAFASGSQTTETAQNPQEKALVALELAAQKQVLTKDSEGKTKVNWQPLAGENLTVQPGDVVRYVIASKNTGDRAAENFVLTQPVPQGTTYVKDSAKQGLAENVAVTYSIDGGKTYVAQPVIPVTLPDGKVENRPAPLETYTHVRWQFPESLKPSIAMNNSYQVKVR
jgi:uncharacterized repeat protein (TIGR01451 family)